MPRGPFPPHFRRQFRRYGHSSPIRVPCHPVSDAEVAEVIRRAHRFASAESLGMERDRIPRKACLNDIRLLSTQDYARFATKG